MSRTRKLLKSLLIVAIFFIAALIAIPNLIRSPLPQGTSPVGSLRTINTAEITYASTYPKIGFSPSLAVLGCGPDNICYSQTTEEHAGLVDPNLASGVKSGYRFTYAPVWDAKTHTNISYTAHADPIPEPTKPPTWWERQFHSQPPPQQLERHFSTDQSGVICYAVGKEVTADNCTPL
jgi:hypothetical protein